MVKFSIFLNSRNVKMGLLLMGANAFFSEKTHCQKEWGQILCFQRWHVVIKNRSKHFAFRDHILSEGIGANSFLLEMTHFQKEWVQILSFQRWHIYRRNWCTCFFSFQRRHIFRRNVSKFFSSRLGQYSEGTEGAGKQRKTPEVVSLVNIA